MIHSKRLSIYGVVWFYAAVIGCAVLVLATLVRYSLLRQTGLVHSLSTFNLADENNIAAWWSGTLLLIVAMHAYDGFALQSRDQPKAARGWVCIGVVFMGLSIDETASLHERAQMVFGTDTPWITLLPFGAIFLALLIYGLHCLSTSVDDKAKVKWIGIGVAVLASVALQEFVEHKAEWANEGIRALRGAIEEGSELVGILIVLRVTMTNTQCFVLRDLGTNAPMFDLAQLGRFSRIIAALSIVVIPIAAFVTAQLPDQHRGHPADWIASASFLVVAIGVWRVHLRARSQPDIWELALILSLVLASTVCVSIDPTWEFTQDSGMSMNIRMLVLAGIYVCLGVCFAGRSPIRRVLAYWSMASTFVAVLISIYSPNLFTVYTVSQVLAIESYALVSMRSNGDIERQAVSEV